MKSSTRACSAIGLSLKEREGRGSHTCHRQVYHIAFSNHPQSPNIPFVSSLVMLDLRKFII